MMEAADRGLARAARRIRARHAPAHHRSRASLLGLWWAVLFALVIATVGRATKFIYVDF